MNILRYQPTDLTPWTPPDRLASLRDDVDRLFEFTWPSRDTGLFSGWSPALDVVEDGDHFHVICELPGMKKDAIEITLQDGTLSISGERKNEREKKEGESFRSERFFGCFQRSVTLPASVDPSKVEATYNDGILRVVLPKSEEAKPKQIAVSVS